MITPAISVLSAVEGLEVATPAFKPYVIPITLAVILLLFVFQKRGTGARRRLVRPDRRRLVRRDRRRSASSASRGRRRCWRPSIRYYAIEFLATHGAPGFFSLGAVVLAVTGAEALYADMGHFGRTPIRIAWSALVLPALALNYFGQGALLLGDPRRSRIRSTCSRRRWALYPLVALATMATVIASQAVISGAYSITQQAMQLGYVPRMEIEHTSGEQIGQIYLPGINWTLCAGVVALVLGFGSSSNLAAAYGIAVTGTMAITTVLAFVVARSIWKWSLPASVALFGAFLLVDFGFLRRQPDQDRRRRLVPARVRPGRVHADADVEARPAAAAVAARGRRDPARRVHRERLARLHDGAGHGGLHDHRTVGVPHALLHSMKHYKSLHERSCCSMW